MAIPCEVGNFSFLSFWLVLHTPSTFIFQSALSNMSTAGIEVAVLPAQPQSIEDEGRAELEQQ